jgi:hypothetical protein
MNESHWYRYDELSKTLEIGYGKKTLKTVYNVQDYYEAEKIFTEWYFS